jgi:hypothetical protein
MDIERKQGKRVNRHGAKKTCDEFKDIEGKVHKCKCREYLLMSIYSG